MFQPADPRLVFLFTHTHARARAPTWCAAAAAAAAATTQHDCSSSQHCHRHRPPPQITSTRICVRAKWNRHVCMPKLQPANETRCSPLLHLHHPRCNRPCLQARKCLAMVWPQHSTTCSYCHHRVPPHAPPYDLQSAEGRAAARQGWLCLGCT